MHTATTTVEVQCIDFVMLSSLVSGFPIVQFLKDWIMQNGRGRPGPFYNMNDVSVYPGTQRGEGSLIEGTSYILLPGVISVLFLPDEGDHSIIETYHRNVAIKDSKEFF